MRRSICRRITTPALLSFSARVLPAESDESCAIPDPIYPVGEEPAPNAGIVNCRAYAGTCQASRGRVVIRSDSRRPRGQGDMR